MATKELTALKSSVFEACKKALKNLEMSIQSSDEANGTIIASTGVSFLSWGEDIELRISSPSWYSHTLSVKSEASAQLISWGANEANETKIINEVSKILYNNAVFCN